MATKPYKMKGGVSKAPDPIDELVRMQETAAGIERIGREIAEIVRQMEALRKVHIYPLEERVELLKKASADGREFLRQTLLKQPEDRRKLLRGSVTFSIRAGSESVEVLNEKKAIEEISALGERGKACIQEKPSLVKAAVKALLKSKDAPVLEHVRLKEGDPVLAEKANS